MKASRALPLLLLACLGLLLSACGGGEQEQTVAKPPPAVLAKAAAICNQFLRETKQLGKGALANPPSTTLELTTERLVKPSIPLLERAARRQQALEPRAHSAVFNLYADLFDPIVILAKKRLAAGRAENALEAKRIEGLLSNLGEEQRRAARVADLPACDVDYQSVLLSSLTE